jgi:hypothetical protein
MHSLAASFGVTLMFEVLEYFDVLIDIFLAPFTGNIAITCPLSGHLIGILKEERADNDL